MKQLLSFFLFLLPCLAWAQYPSNGNQKITLGEQTTADGLIWRGIAADTTTTVKSDTAAYFVLDTVNKKLYFYKVSAIPKWNEISGSGGGGGGVTTFSAGTTGLTPSTATSGAVTLGGTLAVANGGTGSATKNFVDLTTTQNIGGAKTLTSALAGTSATFTAAAVPLILKSTSATTMITEYYYNTSTSSGSIGNGGGLLSGANNSDFIIRSEADFVVATGGNNRRLTIASTGAATFSSLAGSGSRGVNADANGLLSAASSILIKENVEIINYGLSDVLKLKPVIFNYIDRNKWGEGKDLGFVAEDVMNVIPEATGVMNNSDIYFDLQKLVPVLTKAIQEQQALIKALEQRIINLENK